VGAGVDELQFLMATETVPHDTVMSSIEIRPARDPGAHKPGAPRTGSSPGRARDRSLASQVAAR